MCLRENFGWFRAKKNFRGKQKVKKMNSSDEDEDEALSCEEEEEEEVSKRLKLDNARCIALLDMDCFYVAVERDLNPELRGHPVAVAQYTDVATLIAVSYEAKALGVKRGMLGFEAKRQFPTLKLAKIETKNGKADLTKYRLASDRVISVASRFCAQIEKASVDEFYLDLSNCLVDASSAPPTTEMKTLICTAYDQVEYKEGGEIKDRLLKRACEVVWCIRQAIKSELGFECSAGIAENKFLAKSIAGMRKPFNQIALPRENVRALCDTLPIRKAKGFGGKRGRYLLETHSINVLSEVATKVGLVELCTLFGAKEGKRLMLLSSGEDSTPVTRTTMAKSMGASKQFPGNKVLRTRSEVSYWMGKLVLEIVERLEHDGRRPSTIIVGGGWKQGSRSTSTFAYPITVQSLTNVAESLLDRLLDQFNETINPLRIGCLSLGLGGFPVEENLSIALRIKWTCKACTLENDSEWLRCGACDSDKSGVVLQQQITVAAAAVTTTWECKQCTFAGNDRRFLRCEMCSSSRG